MQNEENTGLDRASEPTERPEIGSDEVGINFKNLMSTTPVLPEVKEIEQLRSENEGLKQELAEVYKKIDDLHQWHLSHI